MTNFWDQFSDGFSCLAPMEAVSNIAFRQVVAQAARPNIFFTEFTNVNSFMSEAGRVHALRRFRFEPHEQPIVAQIWGTEPAYFAETAKALGTLGFQAVDINMGCPERHVVASGGCSALIRTPDLARAIIRAAKTAGPSISVKTRLGFSRVDEWPFWLSNILAEQPCALTVHLRTRKEMSKVPAHYELVPEIIALRNQLSPRTKLILNGDIKSVAEGLDLVKLGANGFMIGRGVFANPFCFETKPRVHTKAELLALLKLHLELYARYDLHPFAPMKKFIKTYLNHFSGAKSLREEFMQTDSVAEALALLEAKSALSSGEV